MSYGQLTSDQKFTRLIDSAYAHLDENPKKAQAFLDAIPLPLEKSIKGKLSDYYYIRALLLSYQSNYARLFSNYILAANYAENEKNYTIGGRVCSELFSNIYFVNKDTTAYQYLEKAERFYKLDQNTHGLIEIEQMYAYVKYLNHEFQNCNKLLIPQLEKYKNIKEDGYYYLFALYMITSNYLKTKNIGKAYSYYNLFTTLEKNKSITQHNYYEFAASIQLTFANYYLDIKKLDSAKFHLNQAESLRKFMRSNLTHDFFSLNASYYQESNQIENAKIYLDSLSKFQREGYENVLDASFQINTPLLKTDAELELARNEKFRNGIMAIALVILLAVFSVIYLIYYRKQKFKLHDYNDQIDNFTYLKSNNEKLTGKVRGLEEYILNLKAEIKEIASIHELSLQKERIRELYKSLHVDSSTLLDKSESHLELVNELNVQFFKELRQQHPELNDSEVITCYYLFMGFKNKEIALFLNISIRALESKRYRITKKLQLNTKETPLLQYLQDSFGNLKV